MTRTSPLLILDAVVAGYSKAVVGPVSFSLDAGETVGLVGPNGCGKTTLVNAILGKAHVFEGSLRLADNIQISVQRQRPIQLAEMPLTGREVLALAGADSQPVPEPLKPLLGRRIDTLSGGQYQLLQVWACLGVSADVVILDEPTANIDPQSRALLEGIVNASHELVDALLVISHDSGFIHRVTSRTVKIGS